MMDSKHQVVFVTRALWGGGAEKVLHDLAHGLRPHNLQPVVVYLFTQGEGLVSYDDSIPVYPLQSGLAAGSTSRQISRKIAETLQAAGTIPIVGRCFSVLLPCFMRFARTPFRAYLLSLRFFPRVLFARAGFGEVVNSVRNALFHASQLARVLSGCAEEALVVPLMEEAAVRVWLSQRFLKRPYIVSLHSYESVNLPLMYPDPQRLDAEKALFVKACLAARTVVVPSAAVRQDLIKHFEIPSRHVRVISNPVDVRTIKEKSRAPLPNSFIGAEETVFLSVGRLSPDKNHDLLLKACSLLKKRYDSFRVLCLGEGNMKESLEAQIEALGLGGYISLLGHVPNPYPFMRNARALVVTSSVESFSLVLVEAMICGTVPISVDCPGGPREILADGKYGMLIPPDDAETLADAMWEIAHNDELSESYRKIGPQRAAEYDVSRISREWESLFSETRMGLSA